MQRDGRLAVEQAAQRIRIGAHVYTGDVAQAGHLAVAAGADDDIAKLFLIGQPPQGIDRNLKCGIGIGRLTDGTGRHLHVLLAHRSDHIAGG